MDGTKNLVDVILKGIEDKNGENVVCLDLSKIENSVCKYFIICNANSTTQVNAIADAVEHFAKKELNERIHHKEGFENSQWILVDFVTVVVHVFQTEFREFYNLEGLWADGKLFANPKVAKEKKVKKEPKAKIVKEKVVKEKVAKVKVVKEKITKEKAVRKIKAK